MSKIKCTASHLRRRAARRMACARTYTCKCEPSPEITLLLFFMLSQLVRFSWFNESHVGATERRRPETAPTIWIARCEFCLSGWCVRTWPHMRACTSIAWMLIFQMCTYCNVNVLSIARLSAARQLKCWTNGGMFCMVGWCPARSLPSDYNIYIYIYIYICVCMYMYICVCMHLYIYIYIYTCAFLSHCKAERPKRVPIWLK